MPLEVITAEYIWISLSDLDLRSKTKALPGPVNDLSKLPKCSYDGSSTGQALGEDNEVILYPQVIFKDPFRKGNNILVICDCYTPAGKPIPTNKRYNGAKIFSHPNIVDEEPWYGIKQEYTLLQSFPSLQGPAGADKSFGCDIVDAHYKACLYAGINISGISGTDGEVMPSQWEFQVGPSASSSVGNQLWAARYILERITEIAGVVLSFGSKPLQIDKLVNKDDHLLKPFLLFHLMWNDLSLESWTMSAHCDLPYILDIINIHDLLSEQLVNPSDVMLMETWRAAMDAWSERVICLTCSKEPKRCRVGVCLLGLTCGNCSSARFLISYSGWFKKLLSIIELPTNSNIVRVAVFSALCDLFTRLSLFSNLKKDGIAFMEMLTEEMLIVNESYYVLEGKLTLLTTILKLFPLENAYYDMVENFLVALLLSEISAEDLLKKVANCLAVLTITRADENSQYPMMQKIILEINILLDDYFQGLEGVVDLLSLLERDTSFELGIAFFVSEITMEPTRKFVSYVIPTIMILMQCCGMVLTNSNLVQERVPLFDLVALVRRVLSLNLSFHISLTGFTASTTFDKEILRMRHLPTLHLGSMDLLIAVIEGVRSQFKTHADTVAQMLIEYSKRGLLTHLKIKWYSVMKSLLIIMGDGIVLLLAEELMNNASADLNGGSTHTESSSRHTESSIHLSVKIAALEALKTLLTAGKSLKSQFWRSDMDHLLITIAKNAFNMGWSDDLKLAALDALYASLVTLELGSHRPPHVGELLDLFRTGRQEIGTKIGDFCDDKLMFLQRFISLGLFPFD